MTTKNKPRPNIGPVSLTEDQEKLRVAVQSSVNEIYSLIRENKRVEPEIFDNLARSAHDLHMSLAASGTPVTHHRQMIENRGLAPADPEFYRHVHPAEDLLKFINEQTANDDPVDQTLGDEFTFEVYSRRWGHTDEYKLKRTRSGWIATHIQEVTTGRDGRVNGEDDTGLFLHLSHDSINYPEDLPAYLEWLWERAAEDGLTHSQVQDAVTQLAQWVSLVEQRSPQGIFSGYK